MSFNEKLSEEVKENLRNYKSSFELGPLQDAWVRTLESGHFLQTSGTLCRVERDGNYSFCCLGIAHEVLVENGINCKKTKIMSDGGLYDYSLMKLKGSCGNLQPDIRLSLGLPERYLSDINDDGYSFEEIAFIIRQAPDIVFTGPV